MAFFDNVHKVVVSILVGVKDLVKAIRRINKGKKGNEPVFDSEILPPGSGSLIAVDVSCVCVCACVCV